MLRISGLFLLLCGLLGPSTAQQSLPEVPEGPPGAGVPSSPETPNVGGSLKEFLSNKIKSMKFGSSFTNGNRRYALQARNVRIVDLTLENSQDSKDAKLRIGPEFTLSVRIPMFGPFTFLVRAEVEVDLHLETSEDGTPRLSLRNCRLVPGTLEIVPENIDPSAPRPVAKEVERHVGYIFNKILAERICSFLNLWLQHMRPRLTNEILNLLPGTYNVST